MALEIKQSLKLSQQLVMTPQLQQAIKLLQLNRMELQELVTQEMVENPVLEEILEGEGPVEGSDPEAEQLRDEQASAEEREPAPDSEDFNWDSYLEEFHGSQAPSTSLHDIDEELPSFENVLTKTTSLEEHLIWQLSMVELQEEEKKLGRLIIGNLSEDGYLNASLEDLARDCSIELEDAEEVLKMIHHFDPLGVASRDLQECLRIQARFLENRDPWVDLIIQNHLQDLEKRNYTAIARKLELPLEKILQTTRVILELEPRPGRSFYSNDTHYITPDIYVHKLSGEFVVALNEDGMPKLRISPYYKSILAEQKNPNQATKEYVQEKLRSALWLIRSIHNRQKTIYKVTEALVKRQQDFFEKGIQHLKPMILKDVAMDIGMHESTISRVTTNKYVHTPVGIFELKYFFNSSIQTTDGGSEVASEAVKQKIRQMIQKENPKNPLSDQKIVTLLRLDHINIARRTVAKYREALGILSSSRRKKVL